MIKTTIFASLFCALFFSSCIPTENIKPASAVAADTIWTAVNNGVSDQLIRALHGSPYEFYVLSNSQFLRFDNKMALLEKRILATDKQLYGVPVISDNTFTRVSQNTDSKQVLEFHLTRNPAVIKKIFTSELIDTTKKESVNYDVLARTAGCYSADGTTFFITGSVYPNYTPTAFLIDVQLNFTADDFITIKKAKRIDIPGLTTDGKIESSRYIGKNFYLATKEGGFRIGLDGQIKKLFPNWTLNFFEYKGNIFATGFNSSDFFFSSDGGDTWKRAASATNLKYVQNAGQFIFSQDVRGLPFTLADSSLTKAQAIKYNPSFPTTADTYYDIAYFNSAYFISVGKFIYSNVKPIAK